MCFIIKTFFVFSHFCEYFIFCLPMIFLEKISFFDYFANYILQNSEVYMDKKEKQKLLDSHNIKSPILKDVVLSFVFGGIICAIGELVKAILIYFEIDEKTASTITTLILIFVASVLTGLGVFDKIARYAGAGTLVPVTGFSNAVTSQAMDAKSEGIILGVGAKIFTIAGPVILFGITSGVVYGVIYFTIKALS